MPGQAIVTIGEKQWTVSLATTFGELVTGLGGLPYLALGSGMLFDTGAEQWIEVTTEPMLFPLDIVLISSDLVVMSVESDVAPGQTLRKYGHYFLEVNVGETEGIGIGDRVDMQLLVAPAQEWIGDLTSWMIAIMGMVVVFSMARAMMSLALRRPKPPKALPPAERRPGLKEKRIESAYLTNWQYGGYSYIEEDPARPEELWVRGSVDYANPDEVIAIALEAGLPRIHLAGGFWQKIGRQGWGEEVSIAEARKALAKARERFPW